MLLKKIVMFAVTTLGASLAAKWLSQPHATVHHRRKKEEQHALQRWEAEGGSPPEPATAGAGVGAGARRPRTTRARRT